jgi:hypothetical protein
MTAHRLRNRGALAAPLALLLALAGCAQPPPTAAYTISPIPRQEARIWFYRDLDPNGSMATPYIRLNGAVVGVSQAGGAFYRDVPPAHYTISADSYLADPIQTQDVDLAAGQEIFAKVISLDNWIESGGQDTGGSYHRETFYVWLYPRDVAWPAIAQSFFYGEGTLTAAVPPR